MPNPNTKAEEQPKKSYNIDKFVYRGGQVVSVIVGGQFIAIQDIKAYLKDGSVCSCDIEGKSKKLIVRNSGSGDYVTLEGQTQALEQLIPVMVTKPIKKDKEGKPLPAEYEPNPIVHNA